VVSGKLKKGYPKLEDEGGGAFCLRIERWGSARSDFSADHNKGGIRAGPLSVLLVQEVD
jgi:hypothetical protein